MKKRSFRFDPDENSLVTITDKIGDDSDSNVTKVGLVRDESYVGCCAVFRKPSPLDIGDRFKLDLGNITNLTGEIIWLREYDDVLLKVGMFIEPIKRADRDS